MVTMAIVSLRPRYHSRVTKISRLRQTLSCANTLCDEGKTAMLVALSSKLADFIVVADPIKMWVAAAIC